MDAALVAAAAGFLAARGTKFLDEILKPVAAEIGQDFAKGYRDWRTSNLNEVVGQASEILNNAGITPRRVPGRILMPILEHASYEEDLDLRRKWAALLAHAATPEVGDRILPAILRQLTPVQARIVDWLYDRSQQEAAPNEVYWTEVERHHIQSEFDLSSSDYALLMSDLHRLQIIDGKRRVEFKDMSGIFNTDSGTWTTQSMYGTITLTALGIHFVQACRLNV
jgi:hypothetical protein